MATGPSTTFSANTKIKSAEVNQNFLDAFPAATTWSPTNTGFSVNPTQSAYYVVHGKLATVAVFTSVNGTSNSTAWTITNLPVTPAISMRFPTIAVYNNTFLQGEPGRIDIASGSTTATLYKTGDGTPWTASGDKGMGFLMTFPTT